MLLLLIAAIGLGILSSAILGIIPGMHINTLTAIILPLIPVASAYLPLAVVAVFLFSLAVSSCFFSLVPSIFLGVPDEANALSVLPAHQLVIEGKGVYALKLASAGCLAGVIVVVLLIPVLTPLSGVLYYALRGFTPFILIAIVCFMIYTSERRIASLAFFALSGLVGYLAFNSNLKEPLLPMLSGFFGLSFILQSISERTRIIKQDSVAPSMEFPLAGSLLAATLASFISLFPGLSTGYASAMAAQMQKLDERRFLVVNGAISSANVILSIVTMSAFGKARNGALLSILNMVGTGWQTTAHLAAIAVICASVSFLLVIRLSPSIVTALSKINYSYLNISLALWIAAVVFFFSSFTGLLVLLTASSIGFLAARNSIRRSHLMGCILVPVLIYYL